MSDMESDKKQEKKSGKSDKKHKKQEKKSGKIELHPTTLEKGDKFRRHIDEFFEKSFLERVLPTGKK